MSTIDASTCTGERATYEIQPRNPNHFGYRDGDKALAIQCPDCGKSAVIALPEFDDDWIARSWSPGHAQGIKDYIVAHVAIQEAG